MKRLTQKLILILVFTSLFVFATPALAQTSSGLVNGIDIIGNERTEKSTILNFLDITEGQTVTEDALNEALERLYNTGLFADVSIKREKNTLVVRVAENPIINEVIFEGNKRIEDEALSAEVGLKSRSVFTKKDLQADIQRIVSLYQRSGRFSVTVNPQVIELDQNRVNLVFEVIEGDKSEIAKIVFVGNEAYSDSELRRVIQTKESEWYRFFSSDDVYDPDRLAFDRELLRRHYISKGYADFRVLSASAELTPDKANFIITFSVEEGESYTFGDMSVTSELPEVGQDGLLEQLTSIKGDRFDAEKIESSITGLTEYLGNLGYAFVNIEPVYNRDAENRVIGLHYVIKEGPRVYVEKININGNVRTMDEVIRREFRVAEGDPYNADKIKRSQQRLKNLGFFKKVDLNTEQGSTADRIVINTDIEEQSTGQLTFGAGFSTTDGALGDISIVERNLLGKGQYLKLNLRVASVRQEIDLAFTEPYFLDRNVAAGFDLFSLKRDNNSARSNRTYDEETLGGALRATYDVTENIKHTVLYSLKTTDITDVDTDASQFIRLQAGEYTTSLIGHSFQYDTLDNRFEPTEGFSLRFNQDIAGVGGDAKFFRNELRGGYYVPTFSNEYILKFLARGGHVVGLGGEDVRVNDRFFIGGREIRGFETDGIGPRDSASLDPLGGNIYATSTVELTFPLGLPEELGFKGAVFSDAGTLFELDRDEIVNADGSVSRAFDDTSLRASVGAGVAWTSPFGPVRLDVAAPFMKESYDEEELVRFSFGTNF